MLQSIKHAPKINEWCISQLDDYQYRYKWCIKSFQNATQQNGEFILSSEFCVTDVENSKWQIWIFPNGNRPIDLNNVSVYLTLVSCNRKTITATVSFYFVNAKNEKFNVKRLWRKEFESGFLDKAYGFHDFIKRKQLYFTENELIIDNCLELHCELIFENLVNIKTGKNNLQLINHSDLKISDDLQKLFLNRKYSDLIITIEEREIPAHKNILSIRSSIFDALIEHNLIDDKHLNIDDCTYPIFMEILEYIYTGKCKNLHALDREILISADRYGLEHLKKLCEQSLHHKITFETCIDTLILADSYTAEYLKHKALQFITVHSMDIVKTIAWKRMSISNPQLYAEILSEIITDSNYNK